MWGDRTNHWMALCFINQVWPCPIQQLNSTRKVTVWLGLERSCFNKYDLEAHQMGISKLKLTFLIFKYEIPVTSFSTTAPEKAFGGSSFGNVWVGAVMIQWTLQVALRSTKPHSDAVLSCPVAASGQTADVILLDAAPGGEEHVLHFNPQIKSYKHDRNLFWRCLHVTRYSSDQDANFIRMSRPQSLTCDGEGRAACFGPSVGGDGA